MKHSHLILGGARSGKSTYAEQLTLDAHALSGIQNDLIYVATAIAGDDEMAARIEHHQTRRNEHWQTIEETIDLAKVLNKLDKNSTVLIDCLTLWLSNCLHQQCWASQKSNFIEALSKSDAQIFMVSNEVGTGIVPMGELSRQFVDESGWLHQQLARTSNKVSLVVAGLPMALK